MATAKASKKATTATSDEKTAEMFRINRQRMRLRIRGVSPLIMHRFGAKARAQIRDKQTGKKKTMRKERDPVQEYKDAFHIISGKPDEPGAVYGLSALGIKNGLVSACSYTGKQITKVSMRGALFIHAQTVKASDGEIEKLIPVINHSKPQMREDTVRIGMGTADLRYRPHFEEWEADIDIEYDADVLSHQIVVNLLNRAGYSVGIGEWRPEKDGEYGRFEVVVEAA